jgi:hypothetical protein
MCLLITLVFLAVISTAQAGEKKPDAAAHKILASAVEAQGTLPAAGIQSLHVTFVGQVNEKGQATHSVTREYWLRVSDRSFRILTYANTKKSKRSERGVLATKKPVYWEASRGRRIRLFGSNVEHIKVVRTIREDRRDFERILRIVLLARMQKGRGDLRRAKPPIVTIPTDEPNSLSAIFPDREAKYFSLNLIREGEDPLQLFLDNKSLQIKRVLQFARGEPKKLVNAYYLGAYKNQGGLILPRYISVHTAIPTSTKLRDSTTRLSGKLKVEVNPGLTDEIFAIAPRTPPPSKPSK